MPVSLLPIILPVLLVGVPLLFWSKGRSAFRGAAAASASLFAALVLYVYAPGWVLTLRANAGEAEAQYELGRWTENHCEQIGRFILWPCESDVLGGYAWLEKSAAQDYPPALYALGVRLKYGEHVPQPPGWTGPGGNVFKQPERGQQYIDRALALGFRPSEEEQYYYWRVYRK